MTDALGNETEYDYDVCGRLIEIRQYGEFGNPEENGQDKSASGMEAAPFMDRELLTKLDKDGYLTAYGYTEKGDINRIQYADGRIVTYGYDALRRLSSVTKDGTLLRSYAYDNKTK